MRYHKMTYGIQSRELDGEKPAPAAAMGGVRCTLRLLARAFGLHVFTTAKRLAHSPRTGIVVIAM